MATHKSLKVTFWTRICDLLRDMILYGSINWRRASDGLKPPKLSPKERKMAMPPVRPEAIRPRDNPQPFVIKATPKAPVKKGGDVTNGAIVSDPFLSEEPIEMLPGTQTPQASPYQARSATETPEPQVDGPTRQAGFADDSVVVVRRRKRTHRHGLFGRRAPRTAVVFATRKPGLLARIFGLK